jgi:dihydroceramide fatty acyl 2-hydroxylase
MNVDYEYQRHASARMFQSDFFEFFSKVHPATPFVVYIPFLAAVQIYGLVNGLTTWPLTLAFWAVGFFTWDVLEYVIHRGLFHWAGVDPVTRWIHSTHVYHHQYPDDEKRLVMPLGASLPMAALLAFLFWLPQHPAVTLPMYVGLLGGYLFYDFTHWSTHFRTPLTGWGRAIRAHHMAHHFADPTRNFGLSHRWVDFLVGSLRRRES